MKLLIAATQYGIVPGRNIRDTLDIFTVIKKIVALGVVSPEAVVLLLDFKEAYDSLDREFLARALRWHGLPDGFIKVVLTMHRGTTAAFVGNGYLSRAVPMMNGIQQGCPLALLLFILAVNGYFLAEGGKMSFL